MAGSATLKIFWAKLITAAAMSNCAMGMTHCGENADGFTRLQNHMDELDQKAKEAKGITPKR